MVDYIEKAASAGEPLPEQADLFDKMRYLELFPLYRMYRSHQITKEQAGEIKRGIEKEIADIKKSYEFAIKCFDNAAERYRKIEQYATAYCKDRTLDNADRLVLALDGLEVIK